MKFDTEFIQLTSLGPSIYSLTENLNLLRFGLWLLSVQADVSHVQTVFSDHLSKTGQFYPYLVHVETAWTSVRTIFAITPFYIQMEN
jgi:hypothetical protein